MTLALSNCPEFLLPKAAAINVPFYVGTTGLTLTVTISKAAGAFGAIAGAVTELTVGWYKLALTSGDTDTEGALAFHATDGGSNVVNWACEVAAPVKLADGVAHGGTPGSSTATLALNRIRIHSEVGSPLFMSTAANGFPVVQLGASQYTLAGQALYLQSGVGSPCVSIESFGNSSNQGVVIDSDGDALSLLTYTQGAGLMISTTTGDGVKLTSNGAGTHDVNLAGSGDIHGTIDTNVKSVNGVTVTGAGTAGNAWRPA